MERREEEERREGEEKEIKGKREGGRWRGTEGGQKGRTGG